MNTVQSVLHAIRQFLDCDFPIYSEALTRAFEKVDPVFTRKQYADFFWHCSKTVPGWLPNVVLASASKESEGSMSLLSLWQSMRNVEFAEKWVLFHAKDESRHSRVFVRLVDLTFPNFFQQAQLRAVQESLNRITDDDLHKKGHIEDDVLMDYLMQINMGEIRTRIHMHLLAPLFYNLAPKENQPQVGKILKGLESDEVRHIAYTVNILERWAQDGNQSRLKNIYENRTSFFHRRTIRETEDAVKAYGQGRFPELLEI